MSPDQRKSFRVGTLVAVALALLAVGVFLIGREQRFWERKIGFEIRFMRTNGLRVGAAVSLTGVDIGSVSAIDFAEDPNSNYISVWVDVSSRAGSRIREDTMARVRTIGLLGDKYIELSAGSPLVSVLAPGSLIPSADPIDLEAVLGESGDIITNIVEVTNSLKNVLAAIDQGEGLLGQMVKNHDQGTATLADVQRTMAHLEATTGSVERMLRDVEAGKGAFGVLLRKGEDAERLLASISKAARAVSDLTTRIEKADGALPQLLEDRELAKGLLGDLSKATHNLAELTEKMNRGEGTVGKLINDPELYREAKGLVSSTQSSWMFHVYRGVRGLFPPYGPAEASAPPTPSTIADPTP